MKGHPNRNFAVTSTPTFSKMMKRQTVPQLLPKLGVIIHLSTSPTHGFLCSYSPHWLLIFTMSVFSGSCMNRAAFLAVSKGYISNISLEDAGLKQVSGECFPRKVAQHFPPEEQVTPGLFTEQNTAWAICLSSRTNKNGLLLPDGPGRANKWCHKGHNAAC